ncbi:MAG: C40 family peptidase [Clostridiaceae bacterium]
MKKRLFTYLMLLFAFVSTFNIILPTKVFAASGNDILTEAKKHLGKPYSYGSNGPNSFDCSGFVQYVYKQFNVNLPRTTYDQVNVGTPVSKDQLLPGDIVFTEPYHVGIYVGNNQFIHAPQSNDVIKIEPLWSFYSARRVMNYSNEPKYIDEILEKTIFNAQFYSNKYPDLKKAFGNDYAKLYNHWRNIGINEGRSCSELLDVTYYLKKNPDLVKAFGGNNYREAYNHAIFYGFKEGRETSPVFHIAYYEKQYPNVKALPDNFSVIQNFLAVGMREGRNASANFDPKVYAKKNPDAAKILGTNDYKPYYGYFLINELN